MKIKLCSVKNNFIVLAIWGVIMTFMMPTWQSPDEEDHIAGIFDAFGVPEASELVYRDMNLDADRLRFHPEAKMDKEEWVEVMTKKPAYDREDVMPRGISLKVIKYLPSAIGVMVGVMLRLPTFWVMELAELCALAFYLLVCYLAIMLMPVKKEMLLFLMAFPMTMQQACSINYDSVLLPLSFLLIAYTVKLYYTEQDIAWKPLFIWFVILLLITFVKLPYIMFGLLFFGLPFERFNLRMGKWTIDGEWIHKYRWVLRISIVLVVMGGYYLVRNYDYVSLATTICLEWRQTLHLMKESLVTFHDYYATSLVGCFGWLDSQVPDFFLYITYGLIPILIAFAWMEKKSEFPRTKQIVWMLISFAVLGFFITISMVNHTITITLFGEERPFGTYDLRSGLYAIPYIGGLQGRYYLPFLALPLIAIGKCKKEGDSFAINGVILAYTVLAAITTLVVLYGRYWA